MPFKSNGVTYYETDSNKIIAAVNRILIELNHSKYTEDINQYFFDTFPNNSDKLNLERNENSLRLNKLLTKLIKKSEPKSAKLLIEKESIPVIYFFIERCFFALSTLQKTAPVSSSPQIALPYNIENDTFCMQFLLGLEPQHDFLKDAMPEFFMSIGSVLGKNKNS